MIIQPLTSTSPPITPRTTAVDAPGRPVDELGGTHVDTAETNSDTRSEPERRGIEDVVSEVNEFIKPFNNALQFSIDDTTGATIVKVIDTETEEVIKQIPSEEMLALAKAIGQLKGLLVKQQA